MFNMIKQAQDLQRKIKEATEKVNSMEFVGSASNDLVKVIVTGQYRVKEIKIDGGLLIDKETVEDLVMIAFNDAIEKASTEKAYQMKQATGNLPLPPGLF